MIISVLRQLAPVGAAATMALLLATPALSGVYERTVNFAERGLTVNVTDSVVHAAIEGRVTVAEPGTPLLPWVTLRVAVPADETITEVTVVSLNFRLLGEGLTVPPAPELLGSGRAMAVPGNPAIYGSDAAYPTERVRVAQTGFFRGYRILGVSVAPIEYAPGSGEVRVADTATLRITTAPSLSPGSTLERRRPLQPGTPDEREEVAARVDLVLGTAPAPLRRAATPVDPVFRPTEGPSLAGSQVDMVIVTTTAFADAFSLLADYRTQTGTRTVVRTLDWITANYEGNDLGARVRLFLQDAYTHWGISYAILGADTDFLPILKARTHYRIGTGTNVATDLYYSCLDGSWNADGDHHVGEAPSAARGPGDEVDLEPDIYVGRMPAGTVSEAMTLARKVIWYSGGDPSRFNRDYQDTISFWAEALFWSNPEPAWSGDCEDIDGLIDDGAAIADDVWQDLPTEWQSRANMIYEAAACWGDALYEPIAEDRASVIADFNSGRHFVTHIGHGYRDNMAVGAASEKLFNGDAASMLNGDRLSILYAINCNSGAVDFDCIAEHFLANTAVNGNGGAVCMIAATDLDYPNVSRSHLYHFYEAVVAEDAPSLGEIHLEGLRELFAAQAATSDNVQRWTMFSLIYLGDPSIRAFSALPQAVRVAAPDQLPLGTDELNARVLFDGTFTGVEGATVTLYKDGELYLQDVTDTGGYVTLPFEPASTGAFSLGVTKRNFGGLVFDAQVTAPTSGSYLVLADIDIDDAAGNGNGTPDRGEDLSLTYTIENAGVAADANVSIDVSSTSPYATVTTSGGTVGSIPAGGQGVATPIGLSVATAVPDSLSRVTIPVDVAITSDAGSVTRTHYLTVGSPKLLHVALQPASPRGIAQAVQVVGGNRGGGEPLAAEVEITAVDPGVVEVLSGVSSMVIPPHSTGISSPLTYEVLDGGAEILFDLTYRDAHGTYFTRRIDLEAPENPDSLWSTSGVDYVTVAWAASASPDVMGYNLYRETAPATWVRANIFPVAETYFADLELQPLTAFRFAVTAVDSSGNESAPSDTLVAATSPATTGGFPIPLTSSSNRSSPTVVDLDADGGMWDIFVGTKHLYAVRGDGTDVVDGDGFPATVGIFSEEGVAPFQSQFLFWSKPAVADLDGDGQLEIVATHHGSGEVLCWSADGTLLWRHTVGERVWSSPAVGDIDGDGDLEIVFWSGASSGPFRGAICAFNHDGSEVRDGDANPDTHGILWVTTDPNSRYNYGSVSLGDYDGDGDNEIVAGERRGSVGRLHVLDVTPTGTAPVTGFPYTPAGDGTMMTSSPAVVDLDGDGKPEIFICGRNGLYGIRGTGGAMPGYPKIYTESTVSNFRDYLASPVLGDLDGDGKLDVAHGWAFGEVYAYDAVTGNPLAGWPINVEITGQTIDAIFFNAALNNVDADPLPELVISTGGGRIYAFNGDGSTVGGFPYNYGGTIHGGPAVWDINADGDNEVVIIGETGSLTSLSMVGARNDQQYAAWPQFRHDPRNSGRYGSGLGHTPIDLGSVEIASTAPGRVDLRWTASGATTFTFRIERALPGAATREVVGEVDARGRSDFSFTDTTAPPGQFVRYWIVGLTASGSETEGPFGVRVQVAPSVTSLFQNRPNPFNPRTTIEYVVGDAATGGEPVRLEVFDVAGRRVAELLNEVQAPGGHRVVWDGRDDAGRPLASGLYLYRLTVGEEVRSRKLVLNR